MHWICIDFLSTNPFKFIQILFVTLGSASKNVSTMTGDGFNRHKTCCQWSLRRFESVEPGEAPFQKELMKAAGGQGELVMA